MTHNRDASLPLSHEAAAETHVGKVRDHNEDHHLIDPNLGLYVVCDGMGGHQAGEVASEIAVGLIHQTLTDGQFVGQALPEQMLVDSIMAGHRAIMEAARKDDSRRGMGTTAVVVWVPRPGDVAWIAHVGDSRAYLWRNGQLQHLTEDHTVVNRLRQAGALPAAVDDWPNRHMLSQALGGSAPLAPDVSRLTLRAEDVLLLCSDGLTDMLADEAIARQLATVTGPRRIARALVSEANRQGGKDNITVVAIHVARREESSR